MKKLTLILIITFISFSVINSVSANGNKYVFNGLTLPPKTNQISQAQDVEELVKRAFDLYKQKKYDESLAVCARISELSPKDFRTHIITGLVYFDQKKFKISSDEFAKSISLKPTVQAYMLKANVEQELGKFEEAITSYRRAIELEPNLADAYWGIGDILIEDEKRRGEAITAYQSAVKLDPRFSMLYESLGEKFLYNKKDEKLAELVFRKQLAADEKLTNIRFSLGRLLVKQGRLKEARGLWESRTSDEDNTMPNFITVLVRAEKLKKANDELAKKPNDPETLLRMGFAVMDGDSWVSDGRQEKAIEYFKKALTIKPKFIMAQYGICKAYIQIANIYKSKNKNVNEELAKLKKLDVKLAKEIEEYRKTYSGGLRVISPPKTKQ